MKGKDKRKIRKKSIQQNIERQQIVTRDNFSYEEKQRILLKSNNRCCHCGKECYIGFGATIDHFIPLSEGGTNQDINTIMLCEKCNMEKNSKILNPNYYLEFLNEKHKKALCGYVNSYIHSFEYISRHNLLAFDEYPFCFSIVDGLRKKTVDKYNRDSEYRIPVPMRVVRTIKRARTADVPKITQYYIKYLKKYDSFLDEESAWLNVEFWMKFGCIYYIEKCGEITVMSAIIMKDTTGYTVENDIIKNALSISLFPYYNNQATYEAARIMIAIIQREIMKEREIRQLPYKLQFIRNDPMHKSMLLWPKDRADTPFVCCAYITGPEDESEQLIPIDEDEHYQKFVDCFTPVHDELKRWCREHPSVAWMETEVIDPPNPWSTRPPKETATSP